MFTVLIAGARSCPFFVKDLIKKELEALPHPQICLVHGGAYGVDVLADEVGHELGLYVIEESADWVNHGRGAGPERNQRMVSKWKPNLALFFHHSALLGDGTLDCYRRCQAAGITCKVIIYDAIVSVKEP